MNPPQLFIPFDPSPPSSAGGINGLKMSDPKERFFRHFQAEITIIQDQIDDLATLSPVGGERQDCTDAILGGISRLSSEVMDAAEYIPAYDQRAYSQAIKGLTEKLNETTGRFAPKSRFQFKPKTVKISTPTEPTPDPRIHKPATGNDESHETSAAASTTTTNTDRTGTESSSQSPPPPSKDYNTELSRGGGSGSGSGVASSGIRKPSFTAARSIALHGHSGLHIMLPATAAHATSSGELRDLDRCIVDMSVPTMIDKGKNDGGGGGFAGLVLRDVRRSLVVAGRVQGPAHITGLRDCVVVVAARQVRIHECRDVDVYLHCASHPIIEYCEGMRFAPLPEHYATKSGITADAGNQWDQVDDFRWLKTEPSPNWRVLPPAERVPEDVWANVVCGTPSMSTVDILRRVGVSGL
ncbi:TBCC-domain-containing protein [Xylariaceae sp. FL0804]|nr:TBCC-domain-containing protein [Xylariaceae sp. FL0804]